jgi:hypothetical protein
MKDWIQEQYLNDEQPSYDRLREVVRASWDALPEQFLKELIDSLQARCEAVLLPKVAIQNIGLISKNYGQNSLASNPCKGKRTMEITGVDHSSHHLQGR